MNNGTQWMYIRVDRELYQHCNFKVFSRKMNHSVSRLYEIVKQFPVFFAISLQHHLCRANQRSISTVKEQSHMANTHFKIIRQDLWTCLEDTKRQQHALNKVLQGFASARPANQLVTMIVNFCLKNFEFALLMNVYMYP